MLLLSISLSIDIFFIPAVFHKTRLAEYCMEWSGVGGLADILPREGIIDVVPPTHSQDTTDTFMHITG